MPRAPVATDSDFAVGKRLQSVRAFYHLSQSQFAAEMGLKRERLASYEAGRVPLPALLALRICRHFVVNERWLATGDVGVLKPRLEPDFGSMRSRQCWSLEVDPVVAQLRPRVRFTDAAKGPIGRLFLSMRLAHLSSARLIASEDDSPALVRNFVRYAADYWMSRLSGARAKAFFQVLLNTSMELLESAEILENEVREKGPSDAWKTFDNVEVVRDYITSSMLSHIPNDVEELRHRLNDALSERGAKSALAKEFNVTRQTVNGWLTGAFAPSADTALGLIHWVMEAEAKTKSAGRVAPRPTPKTRKANTVNENQSDRRRR